MAEHIQLDVPLSHVHASTVRAVTVAICADLGYPLDVIEDLRLGVNEAVTVLADVPDTEHGRLTVVFEPAASQIAIRCVRSGADDGLVLDDLAERILDTVVDDHHVTEHAVTVVKQIPPLEV